MVSEFVAGWPFLPAFEGRSAVSLRPQPWLRHEATGEWRIRLAMQLDIVVAYGLYCRTEVVERHKYTKNGVLTHYDEATLPDSTSNVIWMTWIVILQ
eukprot:2205351-Amphidinium_carterae.1